MDPLLAIYITGAIVILGLFFATLYHERHSK